MMITCIKGFSCNGVKYYTKGNQYEMNTRRERNYTISPLGSNCDIYVTIGSNIEDVNYRFPLNRFKEYFLQPEGGLTKDMIKPLSSAFDLVRKTVPTVEVKPINIVIINPKDIKMALKSKKEFNVRDTFLALTSYTYPHGNEHRLRHFLPDGSTRDRHGNYIYQIGNSRTIFASHLDTANSTYGQVTHVIDGDIIKTDGKTILGADDKAGVTVLLYLIHNRVPGTYYFFVGEECGCIGSKAASKDGNFENYDRIISFDRRNVCSIITYQQGSRCCSNDFAMALSEQYKNLGLDLNPDDTGLVTDSAQFTSIISECTNISVGYYSEHTHNERQDIGYLTRLCNASIQINWEGLPKVRDNKITERKHSNYNSVGFQTRQEGYTHHPSKNGRYKNHNYNNGYRGGHQIDLFAHSYNQGETWFDQALDEDLRKKNKKKNKEKKKNKNYRFDLDDINGGVISNLIRTNDVNKDPYLTFKELLSQNAFIGDPTLLTPEEYAIVDENMVKGW